MNAVPRRVIKLSLLCYRVLGYGLILYAILMSLLYFALPLFMSADKIKSQVLNSFNLPVQFESIEWGIWGFSPTVVINHVSLYQQKVDKIMVELDWLEWWRSDKITVKKIIFKKANLFVQYREDKIYLDNLPQQAILFQQNKSNDAPAIKEVILIDSHLVLHNNLNQVFEAKHTDIDIINSTDNFAINVKGKVAPNNRPFDFGLALSDLKKPKVKSKLYIAGEGIELADLQFFFKDILISGQANAIKIWMEGEWGNFHRLLAKGKVEKFQYSHEGRKLFYPYLIGQFGIEWKPDATEYLGLDLYTNKIAHKTPLSHFYVNIPHNLESEKITLMASEFILSQLDPVFEVFLADQPGLVNWWCQALPRGTLAYFNVSVPNIFDTDSFNIIEQLSKVSGEIIAENLLFHKNPYHLNIDKLDYLAGFYLDGVGKFFLKSDALQFQEANYYPESVSLKNISGTGWYWNESPIKKKIYIDNLSIKANHGHIEYNGFWEKDLVTNLWETESLLFQESFEIKDLLKLVPNTLLNKGLSEWLNSAMISGKLKSGEAILRGKLKDFPYAVQSKGVVEANLFIDDADIKYQPNWPELKNADGLLELEGPRLTLNTLGGEIANSELVVAKGVVLDIEGDNPNLKVDAKISSDFTKAKDFIESSPLKHVLSEKLEPINIKGPVEVLVNLNVPLNIDSVDTTKYKGMMNFQKTQVQVPKFDLNITSLKGSIFFSPRGMTGLNLVGQLFGEPTKFSVVSDILASDPRIKISAEGKIGATELKNWFNLKEDKYIFGKTDYKANLFLKNTSKEPEGELKINSDLHGLSVKLPEPFQKKAEEKEIFDFNVQFSPRSIINMQLIYGNRINIDYELTPSQKSWVSNSVKVVLGEKPKEEKLDIDAEHFDKTTFFSENPFSVQGQLESLDLSEWQKILSGSHNGSFAHNFSINLKVKKLKAFGQVFENMTIQVSPSGLSAKELVLKGEQIRGKFILPDNGCKNKIIKAEFDYLSLPKGMLKENKSEQNILQSIKSKVGECPIELRVEKLALNDKVFENVFFHLIPENNGFKLKEISANAPSTKLQASGFWRIAPKSQINLKGVIDTRNIHQTLQAGGIESTLYAAKGQIRFDLNWEKDLMDIDLSTINGTANLSLRNGYIKGADPGIGRILSLLSIDNLIRRLQLDFSDVAKEGLVMDKLTATFNFNKGIMATDDLILESPPARVEILGQADLKTKNIQGNMKVMPKITGSLPIAAAIAAGNPAVGAAVWVADKVLGRGIQEMTRYQYHLSGTIEKPKLISTSSKIKKIK